MRLTGFELSKIWRKKSFLLLMVLLVSVNLFFLWYLHLPGEAPPLSSYRALQQELSGKTEAEKKVFLTRLHEEMEIYALVNEILLYQSRDDQFAQVMEQQLKSEHPDLLKEYGEAFRTGDYLRYTDSFEQEQALIDEAYAEMEKVSGYGDFLISVAEQRETMASISVFNRGKKKFSSRNAEKELADYGAMEQARPSVMLSKSVRAAVELPVTDLLLYLSVFSFAGGLICEERSRKLFLVIRASARGRAATIGAKLAALAVHCIGATAVICGSSLVWCFAAAGMPELGAPLQSLAPYMESALRLSIGEFLLLGMVLKAAVIFVFGELLLLTAMACRQNFMSAMAGAAFLAVSGTVYALIPANSSVNWLKYLNFIGAMRVEALLGGYLNFDLLDCPVSRLFAVCAAVLTMALICGAVSILLFLQGTRLSAEQSKGWRFRLFCPSAIRPHSSLFLHEGWKIMVLQHAAAVLLAFILLAGYQHLSQGYTLTPAEHYYQNLMVELEGPLTEEKEALVEGEQARYDAAFAEIERIEGLQADGKISEMTASSMTEPYYRETIFYPSFQRILAQYDWVKGEKDRVFVYDTGYLMLLGMGNDDGLLDYLLLTACLILAFSSVFAMEYQNETWKLLSATALGAKRICRAKVRVCLAASALAAAAVFGFRTVQITRSCPLHQLWAAAENLSVYGDLGIRIPLILLLLAAALVQILVVWMLVLAVLYLSDRVKGQLPAMCLAALALAVPPVLCAMDLTFARWWSLLPLYQAGRLILESPGRAVCYLSGCAAAFVILRRRIADCRTV